MKLILALVFGIVSFSSFATTHPHCNADSVGKKCKIFLPHRTLNGICSEVSEGKSRCELVKNCAERPHETLNLHCRKNQFVIGNCRWPQGYALPICRYHF